MSRGAVTGAKGGALVGRPTVESNHDELALLPLSDVEGATGASANLLSDLATLLKLRVNILVLLTSAVGYVLALPSGVAADFEALAHGLLGTFILAASASAMNQVRERELDRAMPRTADRPLAAGRRSPRKVAVLAIGASILGFFYLALASGWLPATLGLVTFVVYAFAYTPLKRRSPLALHVGAISGALPPVIGWTIAGEGIGAGAWVLFALLFFWQIPHFHAIAWLYRDDYRAGGFRMLAVVRPDGRLLAFEAVVMTLVVVAVSLLPAMIDSLSSAYLVFASGIGLAFVASALVFAWSRSVRSARVLMAASLIYLPLVLLAWVASTP
ncbi:MAG TPA: heme o synthase [Planctomycetota bacterium]|nr:heme o synthase [Planctomycetota bacterium]